ncbi:MAG: site-specific integrase [Dechloromonas sp.]|nr:site-specific integrase [Dechloromonas sp.]
MRTLRARQAELEQQLANSRSSSQQAALAAAEEEAAGTRATVGRLRAQIDGLRREAQVFSGNCQEARAMEDDVIRLEGTRRNAIERLEKLGASESARLPALTLIEAAAVNHQPWRPDYLRDAMINLAGAFALGLLAVWFVELFNRSPSPQTGGATTVVVPQPWMPPALGIEPASPLPSLAQARPAALQLTAAASLPRELAADDVEALLAGADEDGRRLCAVLLLGLTADEARNLKARDVDLSTLQLTVGSGPAVRRPALPEPLARALANAPGDDPERPLLANPMGQALSPSEISTRLACAVIDAGLDEAASVSPEVLRHTCIANLMRQNVRFSSLAPLVGNLSPEELAAYAAASDGPRHKHGDGADPILPALRDAAIW